LSEALVAACGNAVRVVLRKDVGTTGNFEVTLSTGEVLHSKHGGGGRCESSDEKAAVVDKVMAWLAEQ